MKKEKAHNRSRRQLLKQALGGGIAISAPLWANRLPAMESGSSYDVIIVGAGASGLFAAKTLLEKGYRVRVLEAMNRHGGRIYSRTLGDTRIEMGAEEHYLAQNNPIFDAVIEEYGAGIYTRPYVGEGLLTIDGNKTCWEDSGNCYLDKDIETFWEYWKHYTRRDKHQDFSITMADDVLAHYGVDKNHRAYHLYENSIAHSIFAASMDRIGAASLAQELWHWSLSSSTLAVARADLGYSDILDQIWWGPVLPHVSYERPVTGMDYGSDHVVVTDAMDNQYHAHQVIVTASIGVLQSETIEFNPVLPDKTIEAYRGIGMGRGMKVAIRFKNQFWEARMGYFVTDGLVSNGWAPSHYKTGTDDHIIMCYPMGDTGQALTDMASAAGNKTEGDAVIVRALLDDLDQVFGGKASPEFVDAHVQDWTAEPYVRGSYSYPMLETYRSSQQNMRRQLGQPVAERLIIAGEGSNPKNPATVPGAMEEGARASDFVHKMLKGVSGPPQV